MANTKGKNSYKDSLNLPQTEFPIRSNPKADDPAMIKRWEKEKLYEKSFYAHEGAQRFVFHDGPPYANGNIHLGSAYNKILKDIACKSRRMMGMQVPVTPGWDCHGLPIEIKVTKESPGLSGYELIKACRSYASHWVTVQKEQFKQLGVLMNWDQPYLTMNPRYEAKELEALGFFVKQGYIERSNKTVPWCSSCKTVLATAEIEYADRKDPSIYVLFPLSQESHNKFFAQIDAPVNVAVWTTTPWTLPLNRAVLVKPETVYVLLNINGTYVIVGSSLADDLCAMMEVEKKVVQEISSESLAGLQADHPFIENFQVPILEDEMVLTDEGTAFVHCAPGAGPQDYETGIKNKLAIFSPVGPDGRYTDDVQLKELKGMSVADGQIWVIKKLAQLGRLLHKKSIRHSYPHCWRCRNGLIFRATKQWFFSLEKNNLKQRTLEAAQSIATLPEKSINRLTSTIEGRLEWCISRQRVWGVPIPALICTECDETFISQEFVDKVATQVAQDGIEYWHEVSLEELTKGITCTCGSNAFKKEKDILDVWFDSGLSHYAVLLNNPLLGYPADLYLEGKDQHRGWFQSSLLTSMALEGDPAMRMIITHGYTVDAKGHKMSKSLGNVIAPPEIIEKIGTDGLRLWASSIDFSSDAIVSEILLKNVQEVFRKVRNTCRFLLSNLYDFDIDKDAVPLDEMRVIDQHALQELFEFDWEVINAYKNYDFTAVFHKFGEYASVDLSTFYFEIVKDTLYVEKADGHARRSVQTACWHILDTLTRLMAPIFSFTAEQVSDLYQKDKTESIHLQKFNKLQNIYEFWAAQESVIVEFGENQGMEYDSIVMVERDAFIRRMHSTWDVLKLLRSAILKATETLREKGEIKRSLDSKIKIYIDPKSEYAKEINSFFEHLEKKGEAYQDFFKEFAVVSQFERTKKRDDLLESTMPGVYIYAAKADGEKCPRCWQWAKTDHSDNLCPRCTALTN